MKTAADIERDAIENGLDQLRHGWTPAEIVAVLADAVRVIDDARIFCQWCDEEIEGDPVTDPSTAAWIGAGAEKFCCRWCLEAREQRDINTDGGVL